MTQEYPASAKLKIECKVFLDIFTLRIVPIFKVDFPGPSHDHIDPSIIVQNPKPTTGQQFDKP